LCWSSCKCSASCSTRSSCEPSRRPGCGEVDGTGGGVAHPPRMQSASAHGRRHRVH
jgi:hypothetical protein